MISIDFLNFSKLISKSVLFLATAFISFSAITAQAQTQAPVNSFAALCYHDISNGFVGNAFSLRKKDLITQFDYLKAHYKVVSLKDLTEASLGKKNLPPKAVLLTFDDGLASFYENVYPLLKEYKFKAVFAVVGKWTEDGTAPDYGFKDSNPKMATWKQLKEMSDSGWVDVVSHSYDLHQGQVYNPQGNQAPMASFFKYNTATKSYQTDEDFVASIQNDLKKNNELIKKHLGKDNSVIVWPYGEANGLSRKAAENAGLTIQMSLRAGLNNASDLAHIGRGLMLATTDITQFAMNLEHAFMEKTSLRMIRVDLDSIWKKTEAETEQGLGDLLEEALALAPNSVLLQAISDSDEAYFATSHLPVRGDYLNRTAHTMRYRARIPNIYARLPQRILKDPAQASAALIDLAKYTDIDGIFFEVSSSDKIKDLHLENLMTAARSIRPYLQFGLIGAKPTDAKLFDYVILNPKQLAPNKSSALSEPMTPIEKQVVALPQDYKLEASHLKALGYKSFYYDVNLKNFTPDADFKSLFSVTPVNPHHSKGEAK